MSVQIATRIAHVFHQNVPITMWPTRSERPPQTSLLSTRSPSSVLNVADRTQLVCAKKSKIPKRRKLSGISTKQNKQTSVRTSLLKGSVHRNTRMLNLPTSKDPMGHELSSIIRMIARRRRKITRSFVSRMKTTSSMPTPFGNNSSLVTQIHQMIRIMLHVSRSTLPVLLNYLASLQPRTFSMLHQW